MDVGWILEQVFLNTTIDVVSPSKMSSIIPEPVCCPADQTQQLRQAHKYHIQKPQLFVFKFRN